MEPEIRYCRTADGVRIAYAVSGDAPTVLVQAPNGVVGALQYEVMASRRRWFAALSERFTVVRYDARGSGLSQRDVPNVTAETLSLDLSAVVERTAAERVVILAMLASTTDALLYVRDHPERVSHLIIWPPPLIDARDPRMRVLGDLALADWRTFLENFSHIAHGWEHGGEAHQFAEIMDVATSREQWLAWVRDSTRYMALALEAARHVTIPTLVMQSEEVARAEHVAELVSALPDARLRIVDASTVPYISDVPAIVSVIADFVGISRKSDAPDVTSGTAVILFTDIVDSTPLTESMGDTAFRDAARALDDRMRAAIREAGGSPVEGKVLGDGVMAVFSSAAKAIDAALACVALSAESELRLHIGVHAGDVISERDNVYGGAVNVAARICGESAPGEILVSATIRDLARTSAGVTFEDCGERALKGIDDPVRLFAVRAGLLDR